MRTTRSLKAAASASARRLGVAVVAAAGAAAPLALAGPAGAASYSGYQWGLEAIGAPTAWQYGAGAGVTIGMVDTGIDYAQQDLTGKVVAGATFLSNPSPGCATAQQNPGGGDDNGHGTHVAGIAAASGQYGVTGVAPAASLVVAKVLDCQGSGQYQDVVSGINWVVAHGARVVNLSLGDASIGGLVDTSNLQQSPLGQALQAAWNAGAVPVIAAGNNSNGILGLGDANYTGVPAVVVAATGSPSNGEQDSLASYSNDVNQAEWGVAAPGGDDPAGPSPPTCGEYDKFEVLSTYWTSANATGCYATDEGTSMATPFVTGTLADLMGRGLSASQAVQTLLGTAAHNVACGSDCAGMVNAAAALQSAASHGTVAGPATKAGAAPTSVPAASSTPSGPERQAGTTTQPARSAPTTAVPSKTAAGATAAPSKPLRPLALGHGASGGGSLWWVFAPIVLGLAAAGLVVARRRRWTLPGRPAVAGPGSAGGVAVDGATTEERSAQYSGAGGDPMRAWSDWTSTN